MQIVVFNVHCRSISSPKVNYTDMYSYTLPFLKSHFVCPTVLSQNLQSNHGNLECNLCFLRQYRNHYYLDPPEILKPVVESLMAIEKCSFDKELPLYRQDGIFHKHIWFWWVCSCSRNMFTIHLRDKHITLCFLIVTV